MEWGTRRLVAALFLGMVLAGLPVWWRLTATHRTSLPYHQMQTASARHLSLPPTSMRLLLSPTHWSGNDAEALGVAVQTQLNEAIVRVEWTWVDDNGDDHDAIGPFLASLPPLPSRSYEIFVLGDSTSTPSGRVTMETGCRGWIRGRDPVALATFATECLDGVENTWRAATAPAYTLLFTLVNANPTTTTTLSWEIAAAIEEFLRPLLDQVSRVVNVTVESQVLHYASLSQPFQRDDTSASHYLSMDSLKDFLATEEWASHLASHDSLHPIVNFVLYVPDRTHAPLYIRGEDGRTTPTNAFTVAQWGGLTIYNMREDGPSHLLQDDLQGVMEIFAAQLRELLGFKMSETCYASSEGVMTEWEFNSFLFLHLRENWQKAASILSSFSSLIEKVPDLRVEDELGEMVHSALRCLQNSKEACDEGRFVDAAQHACLALALSDEAFLHHSVLSLLHFPDENKWAIYLPLFFPISLPLISGFLREVKRWRQKRIPS